MQRHHRCLEFGLELTLLGTALAGGNAVLLSAAVDEGGCTGVVWTWEVNEKRSRMQK
jgi:hypothetical protein